MSHLLASIPTSSFSSSALKRVEKVSHLFVMETGNLYAYDQLVCANANHRIKAGVVDFTLAPLGLPRNRKTPYGSSYDGNTSFSICLQELRSRLQVSSYDEMSKFLNCCDNMNPLARTNAVAALLETTIPASFNLVSEAEVKFAASKGEVVENITYVIGPMALTESGLTFSVSGSMWT
jgi:hypothetical protein